MTTWYYEGEKKKLANTEGMSYDIYTGTVLDLRVKTMIDYKEERLTLQEAYTELVQLENEKLLKTPPPSLRHSSADLSYYMGSEGFVFNNHSGSRGVESVYEALERLYGAGVVISVREEVNKLL